MALTKVSTDGVKDDAITSGKIPANAVGASELADNAVDTNAIANNAVTAGKTSGVSTTINNNADNRVITGDANANTLNGESGFIFDGTKLGIGMTPSSGTGYILQLESGQTQTFMTFGNTGTGNGALNGFVLGNDSTRAYITQRENQNINIATNNIDKMILESDGDLRLSSDNANNNYGFIDGWVASTGDMVIGADQSTTGSSGSNLIFRTRGGEKARILNSGGITFNGDTAAANALDDYEEGTWTPVIQGTGSNNSKNYVTQTAHYTKVGRLVTVSYRIAWNNKSADSGTAIISGLPFVINESTASGGAFVGNNLDFPANTVVATTETAESQQYVYILVGFDSGTWDNPSTSFFQSSGNIRGQFHYITNA